jgi:cell pole-organizing protein PopZ
VIRGIVTQVGERVGEDVRMTQPAKSQEPSMEEILASIRRIIADDDATKTTPRPEAQPAPAAPPPAYTPPPAAFRPQLEPESQPLPEESGPIADAASEQSSDILDLTESMAAPMPHSSAATAPIAMSQPAPQFRTIDGSSDIGFDETSEKPAAAGTAFAMPMGEERGRLLSSETSAAVDSAFSALAQTVLVQNARTLEDLVREMLRPMLKSWLDDNLPGLVERLVRAEIERVSRGRSG